MDVSSLSTNVVMVWKNSLKGMLTLSRVGPGLGSGASMFNLTASVILNLELCYTDFLDGSELQFIKCRNISSCLKCSILVCRNHQNSDDKNTTKNLLFPKQQLFSPYVI